jgi:hypothetical protein
MSLLFLAGSAIVGGILGGMKGKEDKYRDEQKAKEQAVLQRRETALKWKATQEEVRRIGVTHDNILNQATVDVGAMGFASDSSSHVEQLGEIKTEFDAERKFMLDTGMEAKDIADTNADLTEKYGGSGVSVGASVISGASAGFGLGKSIGSAGWWTS